MVSVGSFDPSQVTGPDHAYALPQRRVMNVSDMPLWEKSEAYLEYLGFITSMNKAVEGKALRGNYPTTENLLSLCQMLDKLSCWIDDIPPIDQPQRFGNKAFRIWHDRLKTEALDLLKGALPANNQQAVTELREYLLDSFGNPSRIDYGTGHEMAFCMFLAALFKIGVLGSDDKVGVVCMLFERYLQVARKLQMTYKMEPAGSRGVWALDDYQFVPFIWGSSQLIGHPRIEPNSFMKNDIINMYADDYMFIGCIKFINSVKAGPFAEHSNQLWNISGISSWTKINHGLIKMYKAEVLAKFPVIQHVLFGSLFQFKPAPTATSVP